MTWTDPTTQTTGNLITAATWNNEVVENLVHLRERVFESIYYFDSHHSNTDYRGASMGSPRRVTFVLPSDFQEIESVSVLILAVSTETVTLNLSLSYGLEDEAKDTNTESLSGQAVLVEADTHHTLDVTSMFDEVQAGHICGLECTRTSGNANSLLLGLHVRYTRV